MGSEVLACPLCCGAVFPSRVLLRRHLAELVHELRCPACGVALSSLSDLLHHLEGEVCGGGRSPSPVQPVTSIQLPTVAPHRPLQVIAQDGGFHSLIKMEDLKQEAQTRSLTFVDGDNNPLNVMEHNDNHILIVGSDSAGLLDGQSIITTQNADGTISFTPVGPEEAAGGETTPPSPDGAGASEADGEGEVYSCNTCGVSFTSVLQHIQTYHSEQDVVVEVAESESGTLDEEMQAMGTKRVITTSGDIVETQAFTSLKAAQEAGVAGMEEECVDQDGRLYTRRFVKIDKFWNENVDDTTTAAEDTGNIKATVEFDAASGGQVQLFSCRRCLTRAKSEAELKGHACKADALYVCPHCPTRYSNAKSLCAHMKSHKTVLKKSNLKTKPSELESQSSPSAKQMSTFRCEECVTEFPSNKSLRLHRRMHDPVKSRPVEGPIAYNSAERPAGEGGGGGGEGGGDDTYHCYICDKWIHEGYRQIHDDFHNESGVEQHHCEICNRKFLSQDYLLMHMNVHNVEKTSVVKTDKSLPYFCLYCTRRFARPHEKVKHERIHTGEKPHSCEICGKSFRVSYCLTLHMRTHTGARPYECPHCGKRFKAHSVYNHHLLTHSEVRAYKCPYCIKAFKTSVQLAGHKNSHTKPFSCTQCNRPFASLYAVRVHTETHRRQNNLKFSCRLCGASYARAFALKDHMRTVHDGEGATNDGYVQEPIFVADGTLSFSPKKESDSLEMDDLSNSERTEVLP